jgi:hypothetical protein
MVSTAPAFAAEEFYVVMDTSSHQCSVVPQRPTTAAQTVVEAASAMKDIKLCDAGLPPSGAGPATK